MRTWIWYWAGWLTVNTAVVARLLTTRSGVSATSPKLLAIDCVPAPSTIWLIAEGTRLRSVATPSTLPCTVPGLVMPLVV
ncbi:hypothetical protein D3C71_966390 [compost metagenome]